MKKSFYENILLTLFSLIVSMILLEVVLTFIDFPPGKPFLQEFYGPNFKLMCYNIPPSSGYNIDLRNDEARAPYEKIFEKSKNVDFFHYWKFTPYAIRVDYNSRGFREKEFTPKVPGKKRIVIMGDSFTYGHGLDESFCYPRVLEKLLREKCYDDTYEVINLGSGGVGIEWVYRAVPLILKELKPDILIYGYFFNDPVTGKIVDKQSNFTDISDQGHLRINQTATYFPLGKRERSRPYFLDMIRYLLKSNQGTRETLNRYREINSPENWAPTLRMIETVNRSAAREQCRFIVVLLPVIFKVKKSPLADIHRSIGTALEERHIEVLDCLPVLGRFNDEDLYLHPRDRHPNAVYHRKVAEIILTKTGLCSPQVNFSAKK